MIQVYRTSITFGNIEVDAYTDLTPGKMGEHRNFLSGTGMAKSIGLNHSTTVQNRLSTDLKALLGGDLTTVQSTYEMESGGVVKVNLWDTKSASTYYLYHSAQGNKAAFSICMALVQTTLDRIIDDRFDRPLVKGGAQESVDRILNEARVWEGEFSREFCDKVLSWYNNSIFDSADFWYAYVYTFLTREERAKIDKINPVIPGKGRKHRIHSCLSFEALDRVKVYFDRIEYMAEISDTLLDFSRRYKEKFGEVNFNRKLNRHGR